MEDRVERDEPITTRSHARPIVGDKNHSWFDAFNTNLLVYNRKQFYQKSDKKSDKKIKTRQKQGWAPGTSVQQEPGNRPRIFLLNREKTESAKKTKNFN